MPMTATESLLFNELFIEYLRDFFFERDDQQLDISKIMLAMPNFYDHADLINAGLIVLVRRGLIDKTGSQPNFLFQASKQAMQEWRDGKENDRLNKSIDILIKQRILDQLTWERFPKKYWWLISIGTAVIGGFVAKYLH